MTVSSKTHEVEEARLEHRPGDRDMLRAAAHELRSRGLLPLDIAQALGITESAVRQLLGATP